MKSIAGLHSSVYLTAIGIDAPRHPADPYDAFDGDRPVRRSLFARIMNRLFTGRHAAAQSPPLRLTALPRTR